MKKLLTLLSALYCFSISIFGQQKNVVLIIADDLGTDYLGFYEGNTDTAAMPNLRKLLKNGVRFTNATANPICSPTRAGILTGRYSFRTGVGNAVTSATASTSLSLTEKTIPQLLKQYQPNIAAANIGKWHLHSANANNYNNPNLMGYDHFSGLFIGALPDYNNWTKITNGTASTVTTYATTESINNAITWTSAQTTPFFLWLAVSAPHTPFHLPPAGLHPYTNLSGTAQDITQNPELYYKASLSALDTELGRLFASLEASGKLATTDIIFIGDNGNPAQVAQNNMNNKAKGTIYEYGTRVPFLISGPSVVEGGRTSDALVNTVDLFATIQELYGNTNWKSQIPADKPVDSQSILPILQNECGNLRTWTFTEIFKLTPDAADGKAIRNKKYKLLKFDVDGHREFYNLQTDPNETINLLTSTLSAEAQANYNFLNNSMSELLGTSSPMVSAWLRNVTNIMGRHYVAGNSTPINDNVLANVQSVQYSTNWVYVQATGIPSYITGPFLDGNPSLATAQTGFFRFPLNPVANTGVATATTGGNIGAFINGVALFDYRDGVAWNPTTNALCGGPGNPQCPGGFNAASWTRDAIPAEMDGFDCAKAHPANGNYHHHQNPSAFDLDKVVLSNICDLYPADGLYNINETEHSPLIGFAYDGFPIYGAYGYKNTDGTGGIVRIKSSYRKRNITLRTTSPTGVDVPDGPPVNATYPLGYFREDYEYITPTEPDFLDDHNGRFCITPDFPGGIYCYFTTVDSNWNSAYPYAVGPTFYGTRTASKVTTITEPVTAYTGEPLAAGTTVCDVKCFGAATGEITLVVNGGNAPYSFNWGGGITTQNRTDLAAGVYTVTITDAAGLTTTHTATIAQPSSGISAIATASDINCFGNASGTIDLTVSGGSAGYTFLWNDGSTAQNRQNLAAGTYSATITDEKGCTTTVSKTVTQPTALITSSTVTNVACFGTSTGQINLSVSGGSAGYTFLWNDGNTAQNRQNLAAGTYTATVTDQNACTSIVSKTITQPAAALAATSTATDVACFGNTSGAITLDISGGTTGYSFLWNDGNTAQNRQNLAAGTYTATVTDQNGCTTTVSKTINQATEITASSTSTDATCGQSNGSVSLTVNGGVSPYLFNWSTGSSTQNLINLAAGTYLITLTDANGCTHISSGTVSNLNAAAASLTAVSPNCFGALDGSIDLMISGGAGPFTFLWNDGSTAQNRTNLAAGNYFVTISDANACVTVLSGNIVQPPAIVLMGNTTAAACGQNSGSISLNIVGGTAPFSFNWNNGATTQTLSYLGAAVYTVTATDANGCTVQNSFLVTSLGLPTAIPTSVAVTCFGEQTGAISLNIMGGTQPYTIIWNTGATTQNLTNLAAGNYSATITDQNGCTSTVAPLVLQPSSAVTASATSTAVTCFGTSTGLINLLVSGGTVGYSFVWNDGNTTQNRQNLAAGVYSVTVTDSKGCTTTLTQTLTQPPLLVISTVSTAATLANDGSATATGTGGTVPYTYLWSNGNVSNQIVNVAAGTYSVTMTDANGCTATVSITVDLISATGDFSEKMGLKIYPNPATDLIVLQSQNILRSDLKLQLSNDLGQIVLEKDFYQGSTICNLQTDTLYDGIYFLTVKKGTSQVVFKVLIQR